MPKEEVIEAAQLAIKELVEADFTTIQEGAETVDLVKVGEQLEKLQETFKQHEALVEEIKSGKRTKGPAYLGDKDERSLKEVDLAGEIGYVKTHTNLLIQDVELLKYFVEKNGLEKDFGNELEKTLMGAKEILSEVGGKKIDKKGVITLKSSLRDLRLRFNEGKLPIQFAIRDAFVDMPGLEGVVDPVMPPELDQSYQEGKLKVSKELGGGGAGTVYQVKDSSENNKDFAFKTFKQKDELGKEIDVYKRIGPHPNVAVCYGKMKLEVEEDKGKKEGMAMELFEKGTFEGVEQRLKQKFKEGKITQTEMMAAVQSMFRDMLQGLEAMHQAGFVHCDLKGLNAGMSGDYAVKLFDVGSAVLEGQRRGNPTFAYADPATYAKEASQAYDMWSSGQILHRMIQGDFFAFGKDSKTIGGPIGAGWVFNTAVTSWIEEQRNQVLTPLEATELEEIEEAIKALTTEAGKELKRIKEEAEGKLKSLDKESEGEEIAKVKAEASEGAAKVMNDRDQKVQDFQKEFVGKYRSDFESALVDFQNRLMHPNPALRLSTSEALNHPFMAYAFMENDEMKKEIFDKIFS